MKHRRQVQVAAFKLQVKAAPVLKGGYLSREKKRAFAVVINWTTGKAAAWPVLVGERPDVAVAEMKDQMLQSVAEQHGLGPEVDFFILMTPEAKADADGREKS